MDIDVKTNFNRIYIDKTFNVSSFITAYNFESYISDTIPYWEKYDFAQIFFISSGRGKYYTEDGVYDIEPNTMIYRPPFKTSKYIWETEKVSFSIISFVCESEAMNIFGTAPLKLYGEESGVLLDLIKTGARACEPTGRDSDRLGFKLKSDTPQVVVGYIGASLERFLAMVYCRLKKIPLLLDESQKANKYINESRLISEIKSYMSDNLSLKLTINDLSEKFSVNPTTLMKLFKAETNQGVIAYFTDLKIKRAEQMIAESSSNFTEIAETLGFASANYFSKVFKAKTGLTPTEYSQHISKRQIHSICC